MWEFLLTALPIICSNPDGFQTGSNIKTFFVFFKSRPSEPALVIIRTLNSLLLYFFTFLSRNSCGVSPEITPYVILLFFSIFLMIKSKFIFKVKKSF